MKVKGSYTIRGNTITSFMSSPIPTAKTFDDLAKFISWILQRENAKVEIV